MLRKKGARFKSIFESHEGVSLDENLVDGLQDGYRDTSIVKNLKQEDVSNVFSEESEP